ncbi:TPA: hypothetical protein ACK8Z3_001887 [Legionella pneumophila]|nr:hypothetical protein [Legionella pneumophila]ERH40991.1 hypothetical protein N750_03555 [Legionella pneumophila str. Leg01/53]ERH46053.1 hypothetical protein N751_09020 [Legionella pneumophila str. Leg01/11]ERI49386.1 hypothetical protein N749_05245 [Legionella pneumophila str. Leg01/20]ERB42693.1 hypothetical protein N748_02540 [Legionella pneumophila str. 121004]MCW8393018.1 hypothetical protein [Legionella pneumophila]
MRIRKVQLGTPESHQNIVLNSLDYFLHNGCDDNGGMPIEYWIFLANK